jgi:hypothetical protein
LTFELSSKLLSDLHHLGNVTFLAQRTEKLMRGDVTVESLVSIVRLLDSLNATKDGLSNMIRLVQGLEGILIKSNNYQLISLSQAVRCLGIFSHAQELSSKRFSILDRLVRSIDSRIEELEEQDVLKLQKAYVHLPEYVPGSYHLFNKMN